MKPNDIFYTSQDGLRLYAKEYGDRKAPIPAICMHGLTRNHKDFEPMIASLGDGHRFISVDVRGRGLSERTENPELYNPVQYAEDMIALLDHLGLKKVVLIGTSMGGLISMFIMNKAPERITGVILNDVGPVVERAGLERISEYASKRSVYADWNEAAQAIAETQRVAFPEYADDDWLAFAARTYCEQDGGGIVPDFDPNIMNAFTTKPPSRFAKFAMWRLFGKLKSTPLLIIRGENSDVFSAKTAKMMHHRHRNSRLVTVPGRGHAPMLDEAEAVRAIAEFLSLHLSGSVENAVKNSPGDVVLT
ncbi:MAG: alpha/beta hydrolase [Pseudomonadota bacterium]